MRKKLGRDVKRALRVACWADSAKDDKTYFFK